MQAAAPLCAQSCAIDVGHRLMAARVLHLSTTSHQPTLHSTTIKAIAMHLIYEHAVMRLPTFSNPVEWKGRGPWASGRVKC